MIRECCVCGRVYGVKEPLQDPTRTSGYCAYCYALEIERLQQAMRVYREKKGKHQKVRPTGG